jgi:hypothetical protein
VFTVALLEIAGLCCAFANYPERLGVQLLSREQILHTVFRIDTSRFNASLLDHFPMVRQPA